MRLRRFSPKKKQKKSFPFKTPQNGLKIDFRLQLIERDAKRAFRQNTGQKRAKNKMSREKIKIHATCPSFTRKQLSFFTHRDDYPLEPAPVLKAGVAHLWFITIHPFEDGNGRIARAIADCALARVDNSPQRFYSMSGRIERERKGYYVILEKTQKGDLDSTSWLEWFLQCLEHVLADTEEILAAVFHKAHVWQHANRYPLNTRSMITNVI